MVGHGTLPRACCCVQCVITNTSWGVRTRRKPCSFNANFFFQFEGNIFDNLPSFQPPNAHELSDELARYLSINVEDVDDPIQWWSDRKTQYPNLSRMAIDFLTLPGEFVIFVSAYTHAHGWSLQPQRSQWSIHSASDNSTLR